MTTASEHTIAIGEYVDCTRMIDALQQQLAECREERDYLARRLRKVQTDLGEALNAAAALEPTK